MNAIPSNTKPLSAYSDQYRKRQNDPSVIARKAELDAHLKQTAPAFRDKVVAGTTGQGNPVVRPTVATPSSTQPETTPAATTPAAETTAPPVAPAVVQSSTIKPINRPFLKAAHTQAIQSPYNKLTGYVSNEYKAEFEKMTGGTAQKPGSLRSAAEVAAFMGIKDQALAAKMYQALDQNKDGLTLKELAPMLIDGDIASGNPDGKASTAELTESANYIVKNGGGKLPTLYKTYNPVPPAPPEPLYQNRYDSYESSDNYVPTERDGYQTEQYDTHQPPTYSKPQSTMVDRFSKAARYNQDGDQNKSPDVYDSGYTYYSDGIVTHYNRDGSVRKSMEYQSDGKWHKL